jgi:hypothetical protein
MTTSITSEHSREVRLLLKNGTHAYPWWMDVFRDEFDIDEVCELFVAATGLDLSPAGYKDTISQSNLSVELAMRAVISKIFGLRNMNSGPLMFLLMLRCEDRAVLDLSFDELYRMTQCVLAAPTTMTSLEIIRQFTDEDVDTELIRSL